MSENWPSPQAWVCPWSICSHTQAQQCRAEKDPRKGCGGRFPAMTAAADAKKSIGPPQAASGCSHTARSDDQSKVDDQEPTTGSSHG